ncbi:hypothetical protein [Cellulomonas endometrii]|uniref:hypothetical protein n=1 Tax=Cellulomonas endometrii TaxID=3036301 RepID=UPI0024ACF3D4|nr:hypothetical protein [Cellulomonas endometrii]
MTAMSLNPDPTRILGWESDEHVLPADRVLTQYALIARDLTVWRPVVLTDADARVAVIVAWNWWATQHERYVSAAASCWAHWRTGQFDSAGFAQDVLCGLRPPMHPTVHPSAATDYEADDDADAD